jgi:hypothetical protein
MNQFLQTTTKFILDNGIACSFIQVQEGTYNVETGSSVNSETTYSVTMYKKHIKASQYSYPDLVGKDAAMFYLANNSLAFTPAVRDKIVYSGVTYVVDSIQEHAALGQVILYRIVALKG